MIPLSAKYSFEFTPGTSAPRGWVLMLCLLLVVSSLYTFASSGQRIIPLNSKQSGVTVLHTAGNEVRFRCISGGVTVKDIAFAEGTFSELSLSGYTFSHQVGAPRLPVITKLLEVPVNATFEINLLFKSVAAYSLQELGIAHELVPVQAPVTKLLQQQAFVRDEKVYLRNEFYSGIDKTAAWDNDIVSIQYLGVMRDKALALVTVAPVQYNPVTKMVNVFDELVIEVLFEGDQEKTRETALKGNGRPFMQLTKELLNPQPVGEAKKGDQDSVVETPMKYLIISDSLFAEALQPFVRWKIKKGFNVEVAYFNEASDNLEYTAIRAYVQNQYVMASEHNPFPTYILLAGDVGKIATRYPGVVGPDYHATDMWYAEFTGDYLPEAYYGRFPANTVEEMKAIVDKTLEYEQYLFPDPSFLGKALFISGIEPGEGALQGNGQLNYALGNYFNATNGYETSAYYYPESGTKSASIIQDVSNGVGFANYTGHGLVDGWQDPAFRRADVDALQNTGKYPLMIGNACITAKFNDNSFGEVLVRAKNKGAIGYIGASDDTNWDEDFYWSVGYGTIITNQTYLGSGPGVYDLLFHNHGEPYADWRVTMSQVVFAGNMAVTLSGSQDYDLYWEIYHLLGDPSLMVYLGVPEAMNVSYEPLIPLGVESFVVHTDPYAYVAITRHDTIFGVALANAQGKATVQLTPFTSEGFASIVVTAQNKQPYIDSIMVDSPQDAYAVFYAIRVSDSLGNNNSAMDYGDTLLLDVNLINVGKKTAGQVSATLSTNDAYVKIIDANATWGSLGPSASKWMEDAYLIYIEPDVPDQQRLTFSLVARDSTGAEWTSLFYLVANAPKLVKGDVLVVDSVGGNLNGKLDPGETVTVRVAISNAGHSDAVKISAAVQVDNSDISILNPFITLQSVPVDAQTYGEFQLFVHPEAGQGTVASVSLSLNANGHTENLTVVLPIGKLVEDFESGYPNGQFAWDEANSSGWVLSTDQPYEGTYCMQSVNKEDRSTANLQIRYKVLLADSISFYYKVSSELTFDFLQFFVDGSLQGEWSGAVDWTPVSYLVGEGNHLFTWTYAKDKNTGIGEDCGWVDYISFPPVGNYDVTVNEHTPGQHMKNWQLYPNPFVDFTNLSYHLEQDGRVSVAVYNSQGQLVEQLLEEADLRKGRYDLFMDGAGYASGVYLCIIRINGQVYSKKLIRTD